MTAYESANISAATQSLGILAATYQMRLARIDFSFVSAPTITISRYAGAGLTGGTTITPIPLRQGAAAALASSKVNPTVSGTQSILSNRAYTAAQDGLSFQPPFDLIIAPGSALVITSSVVNSLAQVSIYFEELHLARSV